MVSVIICSVGKLHKYDGSMLHNKLHDLWVQEMVSAIHLVTASNFMSKFFCQSRFFDLAIYLGTARIFSYRLALLLFSSLAEKQP